MSKVAISSSLQAEQFRISPEHTRISMAAAIELGLKSGRLYRDVRCGCINLLQNYPEGCYANCTYCGLARERPGIPENNSFIRVAWPLVPTDLVAEKIAEREAEVDVGRVCIAQVQDHRANADLLDMTKRVHCAAPAVPISGLLNATTTTDDLLLELKTYGVDKIGFGLDAASEEIFYTVRGRGARGPHTWEQHWDRIRLARRLYGPMNINCHVIVGLGETDCDLIKLFFALKAEQIEAYVFSFNSEPGTRMQHVPRQPIKRHRRVQLAKHLIETTDLPESAFVCVDAVLRHANEIEVGGKRIAGTGGGWIGDAAVVVGNVLFDFRYDILVDVWRFPLESSRPLADYALRQRVTTLKKEAPWVKPADMERVLIEELPRVFCRDVMPDHLTKEELRHSHTVGAKLSSSDYLNLHADTTRQPRPLKIAAETFIHSERIELGARKVGISMLVHQGIIQEARLDTSENGESLRMDDELDGVPFEGWRQRVGLCEKEVA